MNDHAAHLLCHVVHGCVIEVQRAFEVHIDAEIIDFDRDLMELALCAQNTCFRTACAVYQDIDRAKGIISLLAGILHTFIVADVDADAQNIFIVFSDLSYPRVQCFPVYIHKYDIRAFFRVALSAQQTDSRSTAGYEYCFQSDHSLSYPLQLLLTLNPLT